MIFIDTNCNHRTGFFMVCITGNSYFDQCKASFFTRNCCLIDINQIRSGGFKRDITDSICLNFR